MAQDIVLPPPVTARVRRQFGPNISQVPTLSDGDILRKAMRGKVICSACGYQDSGRITVVSWARIDHPDFLTAVVACTPCGHNGVITVKPNPFFGL